MHGVSEHGQFEGVTVPWVVWTRQRTPTLWLKRSSNIGIVVQTRAILKKPCLLRSLDIDSDMSSRFERCLDMDINVLPPTVHKLLLFLELSGQHCGHEHSVCLMFGHQGPMSRHGRWLGL
jgi:hypothetical protein